MRRDRTSIVGIEDRWKAINRCDGAAKGKNRFSIDFACLTSYNKEGTCSVAS